MDAHGYEMTSQRIDEDTEFSATLKCIPVGTEETGSEWIGRIKFDNNLFNWPLEMPAYEGGTFTIYGDWEFPGTKSGGAHLMNLLVNWHGEIVGFIQRIREAK